MIDGRKMREAAGERVWAETYANVMRDESD
jgi:hypothetical protein